MPYQQHYHLRVWRPALHKRLSCRKQYHHHNDGILLCVRDCPSKITVIFLVCRIPVCLRECPSNSTVIILVHGVPLCIFNMTQITFLTQTPQFLFTVNRYITVTEHNPLCL